jgi:hypothetical protein
MKKIANRIDDDKVMRLIKLILKSQWKPRCSATIVDGFRKWDWLAKAAYKRLLQEFAKLGVETL